MDNVLKTNTVIRRAILDLESLAWVLVEREPYDGPWALCDRAASNAAKQAASNAGNVATSEQSQANALSSQLTPFYRQEMNAQHLYNPEQTNELLNFAEAPLAGSAATSAGGAASQAARTRNTSGFTPALDQAARDRNKAMGTASLGVGAQDITGAKALNQAGAGGMSNLYGVDTEGMLKAMGIQTGDINAEIEAGKSGWFQNLLGAGNTIANIYRAFKSGQGGGGGSGSGGGGSGSGDGGSGSGDGGSGSGNN